MDEVVENLRACLLSSKGGISLNRINKDYYDIIGERIPYKRFNFESLEEFLSVVPGIRRVLKGNEYFVEAIPSDKTSHLAELVRKQKTDKKARKVFSYNKPTRTPYGSSQNYQRNQPNFRPPPVNFKAPIFTNDKMGQNKLSAKSAANEKGSTKGSAFSFNNPTPVKANYIPVTKVPVKPLQVNERSIRTFNQNPARISPTKRMMDKDARSAGPVSETGKPKSNLQSRLIINPPKTQETCNEANIEPKTVLESPTLNFNHYQKDDPSRCPTSKVASIIPFEDFVKKSPQDELRYLALCLNMSLPEYKILPSKLGCIYASVTVGNQKFSSYPDDAKSEMAAQTIAATKALEELKEIRVPVLLPVTKEERIIKERLLKIVDSHPCGVFTSQISKYYKEEFKEILPDDWMRIVNCSLEICVEIGANNTTILTRNIPVQKMADEIPLLSPFNKLNVSPVVRPSPGVLQMPNDPYWVTYVTVVYSTDEIWVRIVDEEYSDQFDLMVNEMKEFYSKNFESTKARKIEVDAYYSICVDQNWYRVRCLEFDPKNGKATVYFIDHGDDEVCPGNMLHDLNKKFCDLPAQALRLSLHGLEEFSDCKDAELVVEKLLLERTLYIKVQKFDSEGIPSVIFFDTHGPDDVDLNKKMSIEIVRNCIAKPQLKTEGCINEGYISHISQIGEVYLQLKNDSMRYLVNLMNKLIQEELSQDLTKITVTKISLVKTYVVKSPEDANWYRAKVTHFNSTKNEIEAFFIDFGRTVIVPIGPNLMDLEAISETLAVFPPQAIKVQLCKILSLSFDQEKIERLRKLAPSDQCLLVKVVQKITNESVPIVELFKRQPPANEIISINDTLVFDSELTKPANGDDNNNVKTRKRSERLTSRYGSSANRDDPLQKKSLKPPKIPGVGEYFDVHVTLVSNPGNFVVQPFEDQAELRILHEKIQETCKQNNGPSPTFESIKEGNLYAAQHPDGDWYRICVLNKFMDQMVTVYFCDYGDVTIINLKKLQPLPGQFFDLPYQAIRAKLAGVKAVNVDWSVEDCLRFKELIEEKDLVSVIKAILTDQSGETVLSLGLIDVSESEDIHIDDVLIKEERAKRL